MNPEDVITQLERMMQGLPTEGTYVPGTNPLEVMTG